MDDNKLFYWREAKVVVRQIITERALNMMLSPKIEGKGMEAEEVNAYNARIANYNDGILEMTRALLTELEEDDDNDNDAGEG